MKKHEISLEFIETQEESISETCKCEFCGSQIRFYRHKRWINENYHAQNVDSSFHRCNRPTSWSEFGHSSIPEGWEYKKSDDDDDRACFTVKKYSRFDK